jgi:Ca2+-binding RTX toxin-like protein
MVAVHLDAGVSYSIDARGSATGDGSLGDPFLELFDANGVRIKLDDDSGVGTNAHIAFTPGQSGEYYIRTSGFSTQQGSYELQVSDPQHPGDNIGEVPGGTLPDLVPGSDVESKIDFNGDRDGYHIEVTKGVVYQFDLVGTGGGGTALADPTLQLVDQNGNVVAFNDDSGGTLNSSIVFLAPDSGFYTLRAGGFGANTGTYALSATILSGDPNTLHNVGSEQDASHHETIIGSDGNDHLSGGVGDDTIDGGNGDNTVDYSGALAGVTLNLAAGFASGADIGFDTLKNIANAIGGAGKDSLFGDDFDNVLQGGNGDDTLSGELGDDTLLGGDGHDAVFYLGSSSPVVVDLAGGHASGAFGNDFIFDVEDAQTGFGNDTLIGNFADNNLEGGLGNDSITGDAGKDTLDGGFGNDTLAGGTGDDLYIVDNAADVVNEAANAGVDTVFAGSSYTLGANLEKLVIDNSTGATATGNNLANDISTTNGNDVLNGLAGNDTLSGNAGTDTLIGGSGKDVLTGGAGNDVMKYNALADSKGTAATHDAINAFDHNDRIDLSAIDANSKVAGNQAFTFHANFTGHAGEVQFDQLATNSFLIQADVDGDGQADFSLSLSTAPGFGTVHASDFVL